MTPISISYKLMADIVWRRVLEGAVFQQHHREAHVFSTLSTLENLRAQAEYNTGSISASAAWLLYASNYYFQPKKVLEVGTFIGKSTVAMALGSDDANQPCQIHTCDMSNAIQIPELTQSQIVQYQKTGSTEMLLQLKAQQGAGSFDMVHLDGRLQPDDFAPFAELLSAEAVILLDDFEGIEKGVANMMNIRQMGICSQHTLVYPPERGLLAEFGLRDRATTALLLPQSLLKLSAQ